MSKESYDVVIVGAGIVGAACAAAFAERRLRVAVVDRDVVGSGATAAGMGHIVVMDDSDAQFALTHYSQQLWQQLRPELPDSVEYEQSGTIWVAADEEEMAEVFRKREYYQKRGVAAEVLDAGQLKKAEPNLRDGLAGGLLVPGDAVLYPPCAAQFLMNRALQYGAKLKLGATVTQISEKKICVDDGQEIAGDIVVNAAGSTAAELTPGLEIKKRKGHLVITDRYPSFLRHQLVELGYLKSAHSVDRDSVAFNVQPRRTGQVLIGSSRQYNAEDPAVDTEILAAMIERARERAAKLPQVETLCADAARFRFPAESFDLFFSRFGVMLFGDPAAAFAHLRRSVELSDALPYDEPWGWMQPTRHALGALLLETLAGVVEIRETPLQTLLKLPLLGGKLVTFGRERRNLAFQCDCRQVLAGDFIWLLGIHCS